MEKEIKTVEKKKAVTNGEVLDAILSLGEQIKKTLEVIKTPERMSDDELLSSGVMNEPTENKYPVPYEYRQIIDEILNKSFGISVEPMSDTPAFTLTIIVPDKYSTMSPAQREMYKVDIRPKILTYADGINGVRLWAEKVLSSFNAEKKTTILQDRMEGN
jgi:hypothetical protein